MVSVVMVRIGVDVISGSDNDTSGNTSTVSRTSSSSESLSVSQNNLLKDFRTLSGVFVEGSVTGSLDGVSGSG